ncbi:PocR ligand-binding domain-containing protein [Clostridium saccharobutylicum]|uniref:histidine kinase n=1 Tax=Clostridium saccharobutylicum TaxID=169679 RepID=A0A1S8MTH8_CLOSA|nr:PocR ligand-binding domain-containing protein [Clostridium saccharobutylicum]OOM07487.1 sensor histidine kinase TodS [Clostridium saccharobutylicum]
MLKLKELINIDLLKRIADNIYAIAGIHMSICDIDGSLEFAVGQVDICSKFHRVNPITCNRCKISDKYSNEHIMEGKPIAYKCLNNIWDIAMPVVISGMHIATIFFGQFFYEDEIVDIEYFRAQALEFGFDEKEYLDALSRIPVLSKEKINYIMEYYQALIMTLAESGLRQLEYKNSQKELEKNRKYLNTIFNSVNDAILVRNFEGKILDVNETAISMFGYSRNEFINMNMQDIISPNSPKHYLQKQDLLNEIKKTDPLIVEAIYIDKNNNEFWGEANIRIANIDGDERIIMVSRNIEVRKQAELELQNEAFELEKLRTEFFANISHELRTPLNIILGAIKINSMNLGKENIEKEKIIKNTNIEKQNCLRLIRLVNNLIDSTKLDTEYFEMNMINCNIINVVEEITLSAAEYINSNNLTLTFDTDIEEKIIACDLDKIERIMLNILSNAVKFTDPGGNIFVNIFDGEEFITILIEDTGIGIPKDKLDTIFDRFRQIDKSFTRNHEGSGIGLSLVKSFVEMQGGKISVESKCGVGTKFCIKLPVRVVDDNNSEENIKLLNSNLSNYVERIKVEFSDIYKL